VPALLAEAGLLAEARKIQKGLPSSHGGKTALVAASLVALNLGRLNMLDNNPKVRDLLITTRTRLTFLQTGLASIVIGGNRPPGRTMIH